MRLLADYHHHDLWESLELLCKRLGWDLYRPIGMDWFDQEYWNFERYNARAFNREPDDVAKQYLEYWGSDLNISNRGWKRHDQSHDRWQNLITLDEARGNPPDIVMASVAHNHEGFHRFAREAGAKFGIHLGNVRFSELDSREDRAQVQILTQGETSFAIEAQNSFDRVDVPFALPHNVVIPAGKYTWSSGFAHFRTSAALPLAAHVDAWCCDYYNGSEWRVRTELFLKLSQVYEVEADYDTSFIRLPTGRVDGRAWLGRE